MLIGKGGGGGTDTVAMEIGGGDGGHNTQNMVAIVICTYEG